MILSVFLKGWIIGLFIALPVGPIGMLCIRHSLVRGVLYGFIAGLGAALADTLYGIVAGYGMSLICDFLTDYHISCRLFGAIFLLYLGIAAFQAQPRARSEERMIPLSFSRVFFTTFFLTLTNPLTILGFMGIYAALGIGFVDESVGSMILMIGGIFLGSVTWWFLLSSIAASVGKRVQFQSTHLLNRISGVVFLLFGLMTALSTLQPFVFSN